MTQIDKPPRSDAAEAFEKFWRGRYPLLRSKFVGDEPCYKRMRETWFAALAYRNQQALASPEGWKPCERPREGFYFIWHPSDSVYTKDGEQWYRFKLPNLQSAPQAERSTDPRDEVMR